MGRGPLGTTKSRRALVAGLAVGLWALASAAGAAPKKEDAREQTAREFYASGKYREAIAVFAQIYAQNPHPNYLFNIGRCYQNLPDPDHAIISFKDYLRKSPKLSKDERKEIEGYIQEMVELKRGRGAAESALAEVGPKDGPKDESKSEAKNEPKSEAKGEPAPAAPVAAAPSKPAAPPAPDASAPSAAVAAVAAPEGKDNKDKDKDKPAAAKALDRPSDRPSDPGAVQLASWHSQGEALWKEQSARADDARLAQIEGMLAKAKPDDPRRADYALFLGRLYAAKHFRTRLKASEARKLDTPGGAAAPAAGTEDRKALDAEANASFLKAVSAYLEASKAKSFAKADEALYQLALLLDANNMESRATAVLNKLVKTMPDSKLAKQVGAGASPP